METGLSQNSAPEKAAPVWEKGFLAALAETGVVRYACRAADVDSGLVYARRQASPDFAAAWAQALEDAADSLEEAAVERARDGIIEYVVGKDGEVRENRKYSDTLLIFLLKGARPEKYRERVENRVSGQIDVTGLVGAAFAEVRK